jgi:hypothetical protein
MSLVSIAASTTPTFVNGHTVVSTEDDGGAAGGGTVNNSLDTTPFVSPLGVAPVAALAIATDSETKELVAISPPPHRAWYSFGGLRKGKDVYGRGGILRITPTGLEVLAIGLSKPRSLPGAVRIGSFIYLIGGQAGNEGTKEVERFDIRDHTFTSLSPLPKRRLAHSCVGYQDRYIYVIGGGSSVGDNSHHDVYIYDINTNEWSTGPSSIESYYCTAIVHDCIYAVSTQGKQIIHCLHRSSNL